MKILIIFLINLYVLQILCGIALLSLNYNHLSLNGDVTKFFETKQSFLKSIFIPFYYIYTAIKFLTKQFQGLK